MPRRPEKMFQRDLKNEIVDTIPGSVVLKTDPTGFQGIPDLLVLYRGRFAALEVKRDSAAAHRPNQDIYINRLRENGYATFVYPENKDKVMQDLYEYFGVNHDEIQ